MEDLILLLEEYWGLTVVGGVTLGTLITLAVFAVKAFLRLRQTMIDNKNILANNANILELVNILLQERQQMVQKSEVETRIITTVFKSLSYIVASSKLTTEDKLALHEEYVQVRQLVETASLNMQEVAKQRLAELMANIQKQIPVPTPTVATVEAPAIVDTTKIIQAAAEGATTLIDKYMGTK